VGILAQQLICRAAARLGALPCRSQPASGVKMKVALLHRGMNEVEVTSSRVSSAILLGLVFGSGMWRTPPLRSPRHPPKRDAGLLPGVVLSAPVVSETHVEIAMYSGGSPCGYEEIFP